MKIIGRVWLIQDEKGNLIDNIDTDMIFHNAYLHITDFNQMAKYAFSNLKGWQHFPSQAKPGDILFCGANFGAGSSRQQAVDCFKALKVGAIVAKSFGAIYKRNAINSALPIFIEPNLDKLIEKFNIKHLQLIGLDFIKGEIFDPSNQNTITFIKPFSKIQLEIFKAGGLLNLAKQQF